MTRWQWQAETRWRCARDLTVAMLRGAVLRVRTPDGLVTAGRGQVWDWRTVRSGDLVAGDSEYPVPDALVAIRLTAEFEVRRLRRALREALADSARRSKR